MLWTGLKQKHGKSADKRQERQRCRRESQARFFSGKGITSSVSHSKEADGSLDQSVHRCTSIESILSLEQYTVTTGAKTNMLLTPLLCLASDKALAGESSILKGADMSDDLTEGLDSSGNDSSCESEVEEIQVENDDAVDYQSSQRNVKYTPVATDSSTVSSDSKRWSNETSLPKETVEERKPTNMIRRSIIRKEDESGSGDYQRGSIHTMGCTVRFGSVEIHEHESELGGSTIPFSGPPLGLGWKRASYQKFQSVDNHLDEIAGMGGPRSLQQMQLSSKHRIDTLLELGYTFREVQSSIRESRTLRDERIRSARFWSRIKPFIVLRRNIRLFCC